MKIALSFVAVLFVSLFFSLPTAACGICAYSIFDYYFPPIFAYCLLISIWVIVLSIFAFKAGIRLWSINPIILSGAAILLAYILGAMTFGPVSHLAILALTLIYLFRHTKNNLKPLIGIQLFFIACVSILTIYGQHYRINRAPFEYAIQWGSAAGGRREIRKLARNPQTGLPELRKVLINGNGSALSATAREMVNIAEPHTDIPILLDTLKRARARSEKSYVTEELEESISKISGIKLQANFSIPEFEKTWLEKNTVENSTK